MKNYTENIFFISCSLRIVSYSQLHSNKEQFRMVISDELKMLPPRALHSVIVKHIFLKNCIGTKKLKQIQKFLNIWKKICFGICLLVHFGICRERSEVMRKSWHRWISNRSPASMHCSWHVAYLFTLLVASILFIYSTNIRGTCIDHWRLSKRLRKIPRSDLPRGWLEEIPACDI